MKIRPLHTRVLLKRVAAEEMSRGGIIIPDAAKEKPIEGEVIAVGKGYVLEDGAIRPLDIEPGNRILFGKYAGIEVTLEGEEFVIIEEHEVLGVIGCTAEPEA